MVTNWKSTIHHEMWHSGDTNKVQWDLYGKVSNSSEELKPMSSRKEFLRMMDDSKGFTQYAETKSLEWYAEHGGYISYMEANPAEQSKKITVYFINEEEELIAKNITYAEYKELYPEPYEYFMNIIKNGVY